MEEGEECAAAPGISCHIGFVETNHVKQQGATCACKAGSRGEERETLDMTVFLILLLLTGTVLGLVYRALANRAGVQQAWRKQRLLNFWSVEARKENKEQTTERNNEHRERERERERERSYIYIYTYAKQPVNPLRPRLDRKTSIYFLNQVRNADACSLRGCNIMHTTGQA